MFTYFYNHYLDQYEQGASTEATVWLMWYCEQKWSKIDSDPFLWAERILKPSTPEN